MGRPMEYESENAWQDEEDFEEFQEFEYELEKRRGQSGELKEMINSIKNISKVLETNNTLQLKEIGNMVESIRKIGISLQEVFSNKNDIKELSTLQNSILRYLEILKVHNGVQEKINYDKKTEIRTLSVEETIFLNAIYKKSNAAVKDIKQAITQDFIHPIDWLKMKILRAGFININVIGNVASFEEKKDSGVNYSLEFIMDTNYEMASLRTNFFYFTTHENKVVLNIGKKRFWCFNCNNSYAINTDYLICDNYENPEITIGVNEELLDKIIEEIICNICKKYKIIAQEHSKLKFDEWIDMANRKIRLHNLRAINSALEEKVFENLL